MTAPSSQPLVTLVVHLLNENPIVRAAPLGWALQRLGLNVEVVGLLPEGEKLYAPYADSFDYRFSADIKTLHRLIRGDVIYSFKPLVTTLLPAMVASKGGRAIPVMLDVEDDDLDVCEKTVFRRAGVVLADALPRLTRLAVPLTHAFRRRCVLTTVSTSRLQSYYGGHLILHGPDEAAFKPVHDPHRRRDLRVRLGLPLGTSLVLFAGAPREHKGFWEIVQAVEQSGGCLVLAGPSDSSAFLQARTALGSRCIDLGFLDHAHMPDLLNAVDVVPIPSHDSSFARAQLPAKLLEAMAMEKAVVVSDIGDLPRIVGGRDGTRARGWIVPAADANALARCFSEIARSPVDAAARGARAREFVVSHASVAANAARYRRLFDKTPALRKVLLTGVS